METAGHTRMPSQTDKDYAKRTRLLPALKGRVSTAGLSMNTQQATTDLAALTIHSLSDLLLRFTPTRPDVALALAGVFRPVEQSIVTLIGPGSESLRDAIGYLAGLLPAEQRPVHTSVIAGRYYTDRALLVGDELELDVGDVDAAAIRKFLEIVEDTVTPVRGFLSVPAGDTPGAAAAGLLMALAQTVVSPEEDTAVAAIKRFLPRMSKLSAAILELVTDDESTRSYSDQLTRDITVEPRALIFVGLADEVAERFGDALALASGNLTAHLRDPRRELPILFVPDMFDELSYLGHPILMDVSGIDQAAVDAYLSAGTRPRVGRPYMTDDPSFVAQALRLSKPESEETAALVRYVQGVARGVRPVETLLADLYRVLPCRPDVASALYDAVTGVSSVPVILWPHVPRLSGLMDVLVDLTGGSAQPGLQVTVANTDSSSLQHLGTAFQLSEWDISPNVASWGRAVTIDDDAEAYAPAGCIPSLPNMVELSGRSGAGEAIETLLDTGRTNLPPFWVALRGADIQG